MCLQGTPFFSRLLTIIGLFCKIQFLFKGSVAKETCIFKEPTSLSKVSKFDDVFAGHALFHGA